MNNFSPSIQKLIDLFSRFPTVGPRTASRFVFYLIQLSEKELNEFINVITELKKNIKICSFCFNPFEASLTGKDLCPICSDLTRDKNLLCLVEKETDLKSIEKTKKYNGFYFILGQADSQRLDQLIEKIKSKDFKEIIIAINPTTEGQSKILQIERLLKPLNIKISRLGLGLPVGSELEYADEETLSSALESRK